MLEPANAAADGWPSEWLRARPTSGASFPIGVPRGIEVTGRFGWPAVPDDVRQAALILASRLLKGSREATFGIWSTGIDGTAMRIARVDPDVVGLIERFERKTPF